VTIEVIGAGFGRTVTISLKVALEELGFGPCYHMTEVFAHPKNAELWEAAVRGEPAAGGRSSAVTGLPWTGPAPPFTRS
jgi:hypothetical protein